MAYCTVTGKNVYSLMQRRTTRTGVMSIMYKRCFRERATLVAPIFVSLRIHIWERLRRGIFLIFCRTIQRPLWIWRYCSSTQIQISDAMTSVLAAQAKNLNIAMGSIFSTRYGSEWTQVMATWPVDCRFTTIICRFFPSFDAAVHLICRRNPNARMRRLPDKRPREGCHLIAWSLQGWPASASASASLPDFCRAFLEPVRFQKTNEPDAGYPKASTEQRGELYDNAHCSIS